MNRRRFLASLLALPAALVAAARSGPRQPVFSALDMRSYWGIDGPPAGNHIAWAVCDDVEDDGPPLWECGQ